MLKRKEYLRSKEDKSPKAKKKKKEKRYFSSRHGDFKVRSVSELAELVTSGAVHVPKSLVEYTDDRMQLLDQVFTILSPTDIKGMLPDILKGLKMKNVKQLCYEQLKTMSSKQITDIIESKHCEENSDVSTPFLSELDQHCRSQPSPSIAASTKCITESSTSYTTFLLDKESVPTLTNFSSMPHCDSTVVNATEVVSNDNKPTEVDEFVISISDVSDVEDSLDRELANCQQQRKAIEQSVETIIQEIDSDTTYAIEDQDEDLNDIQEAEQLLEMEFRRRALEAELKKINKINSTSVDGPTVDRNDEVVHGQVNTEYTGCGKEVNDSDVKVNCDGGVEDIAVVEMNFGTLLEMKLRQKALQSLLTKRKNSAGDRLNSSP